MVTTSQHVGYSQVDYNMDMFSELFDCGGN